MKYVFGISLLVLFVNCAIAQDSTYKTADKRFEVGVDLAGLTFLPLSAAIGTNELMRMRYQLYGSYNFAGKGYVDLGVGMEQRKLKQAQTNFYDYRMSGYFIRPALNIAIANRHLWLGLGAYYANFTESGVVKIGGEYFNPYTQPLSNKREVFGGFFKFAYKYNITPKLSLALEHNIFFSDVWVETKNSSANGVDQRIKTLPGMGFNILNSDTYVFSIPTFLFLSYRL